MNVATRHNRRAMRRSAVPTLLIGFLAAPIHGEEEPDDDLETITVVATRTERSLDEVAATVSIKSAEEIESELARNIADVVRFEPGVTVSGTGSRFGLTGFKIRGIGGNRVLTLIDGVRVPDEFSFGPFLSARRDFVDVDSLDASRSPADRSPRSTAATRWAASWRSRPMDPGIGLPRVDRLQPP